MRRLALLPVLTLLVLAPPASAAAPCSGDPAVVHPITLTVDGEPSTGIYSLPARKPRGLVVFGHGAANTTDAWRRHVPAVAQREGVVAVAMDYRGMQETGRDEKRGTATARGWPAKKGSEDLVAAARHFDEQCPGLPGTVLYGVSMGGNMTGLAAAARATRRNGKPLFDYWIAVEGVHNVIETYQEARLAGAANAFAAATREDIEGEMGGPFELRARTYAERSNLLRVPDIAASGVRGAILVHGLEDGNVPYNQSYEMTRRLRDAGVPTDLYTVGARGTGEPGTTIAGYAGQQSGNAGHGWEGSETHVVIRTGFDRLNALVTRGEPAPCNRDFLVDAEPSNATPDPSRASAPQCKPDPFPGPSSPRSVSCRDTRAPSRPSARIVRRAGGLEVRGRAADRGCGRVAEVRVAVARREAGGGCRFVGRSGRLGRRRPCRRVRFLRATGRASWRLAIGRRLPHATYRARALAVDAAGNRGPARHLRFEVPRGRGA